MQASLSQILRKTLQAATTHEAVLTVKEEEFIMRLVTLLEGTGLGGSAGTCLDILEKALVNVKRGE
jgi:hypothetical protein